MKNNNLGRFILVLAIIAWSLFEVYPPTSRDLAEQFASRARNRDDAFTNILTQLAVLQKTSTNSEFVNLRIAIGTNDLQNYFPFIAARNKLDPNTFILNQLQRDASGKIKLGLDLQGGTAFMVEMDTNVINEQLANTNRVQQRTDVASAAISQAVDVLRKRVDAFGVAEPDIRSVGGNQILIQLPGLSPSAKEDAKISIQKAAYLEFRLVKEDSDQILQNHEPPPPGYELLKHVDQQPGGKTTVEQFIVQKKPVNGLAGDIVKSAMVIRGNLGEPKIEFTLSADGAKRFGDVTRDNVGRLLAIVLDHELYSAPRINSPIENGSGEITGNYTIESAMQLANVLQNPLRAPLHIISVNDVDPTLGKDSIRSGIKASIYGVIFVSVFMLAYYLIAGLAANVALITNIIILLGVMCSIGTTFTLPGIAGGVLTVGMAVDANVLIYERIREELAKGKSLRGAIDAGYARAFGTIFDSHVTTIISSIILIFMGTGEIKGFGVTLTIGVAASLFTALVVTRLIFNFMLDKNLLKSLPMLHIIRSAKVNFMKAATPLFVITWAFIILSLGYGMFTRGEKLFGVDFLGGDSTKFSFTQNRGGGKNPFRPDRHRRKGRPNPIPAHDRRHGHAASDDFRRFGGQGETGVDRKLSAGGISVDGQPAGRRDRRQGNPAVGDCRFPDGDVRHSGLCRVPLRIFLRRGRHRRGVARRAADHRLLLHRQRNFRPPVQRHGGRRRADDHRLFHQRQDRHLRPHPGTVEARCARLVHRNHQHVAQPDLEPHDHHQRHGVSGHDVVVHLGRRRHQRLRVHLPHRHRHRHLFVHLHRQRAGAVVAQGPAPEHRRVAGGGAERGDGESVKNHLQSGCFVTH